MIEKHCCGARYSVENQEPVLYHDARLLIVYHGIHILL